MSAVRTHRHFEDLLHSLHFAPMRSDDLPDVLHVEYGIYPHPWTRGNFQDSLDSGYETWVLRDAAETLVGYFLMMLAVDEAHLLNITVDVEWQGRGVGRLLLDKAVKLACARKMHTILLEVRPSNQRALAVYQHYGFLPVGRRKNYYPAGQGMREDAIVMSLAL